MMKKMGGRAAAITSLLVLSCLSASVRAGDPYLFFTWKVTYGTITPLGVPQRGILINGQFPGPNLNTTTNNNVVINIFNELDEPILFTWNGIQHRKNSWQDGVSGTNCPIPPGTNYTYHFQPKDQIGSYYYYLTRGMQTAEGGYGGLRVNSRLLIPVPFADPEDDYTVLIGDWFSKGAKVLQRILDTGSRSIAQPDGVVINGKSGLKDEEPLFTMKPGKTYRYRICNVGIKTSLNFRIQGHTMKVVEIEGSHTVQGLYGSLDVHVGQCYSVLVTADQAPKEYYMIASTRFTKKALDAKGIIRYENGQGKPSPDLPQAPTGVAWSINQFRSFRWNLTASAARPNPQGSYRYGNIPITRTIKIVNSAAKVNGKIRYAINGVSHVDPETPLKLAEYFGAVDKVFRYNVMADEPTAEPNNAAILVEPNVINATFRNFVEIIFENHEKSIQNWHLDGYSFFAVAIEAGRWSPAKRANYNLLDAVSRYTIQVYPGSWAAIMLTLDNAGLWNLRSANMERNYLGQQLYVSVLSPERSLRDEYDIPLNAPLCGIVQSLPKPPPYV